MSIRTFTPNPNSDSLKDIIISLLNESSSLSAKEIHSKVSKSKTISYQAVFKTLKELLDTKVLEKKESKYLINKKWISELKSFVESFEKRESQNSFNPNAETQTLEINTLFEFFEGMLNLFSSDILYKDCKHRFGGGIMRHLWWSLSFDNIGYEKFKHMLGPKDSYIVAIKDTPVDQWLKSYYLKTGATGVKVGVDYPLEDDVAIVGNYLIQVFFDEKTKKTLDKLYSEVKDISDAIEKGILEKILTEKTNIKVVITYNKELADIYLQKLVSFFGDPEKILANPKYTP
jgi:transcriptional regulator CtsR